MIEIKNEFLTVLIDEKSCELKGIYSGKNDYLYRGEGKYWGKSCPILFPLIGRMYGEKYEVKGAEYHSEIHGFIKKREFTLLEKSENSITLSYTSNEKDYEIYPYHFKFTQIYSLEENSLILNTTIENLEDQTMYYALGFHPGFNVKENFNESYLMFNQENNLMEALTNNCYYTGSNSIAVLPNNRMDLYHSMFDNDALIFSSWNGCVELNTPSYVIKIEAKDYDVLTLWHTVKTDAPFVCIEPCTSLPGYYKELTNIEKRKDYQSLNSRSIVNKRQKWSFEDKDE